jgi:hypothetical protein
MCNSWKWLKKGIVGWVYWNFWNCPFVKDTCFCHLRFHMPFPLLLCMPLYMHVLSYKKLFSEFAYFTSIQGKKWYWLLFLNCFETALIEAWKISKLFCPDEAQELLTFRRIITISYLGEVIPRNNFIQRDLLQNNKDLLRFNNEHILINNTEGRQRRCQFKIGKRNTTTMCKNCNVGLCVDCFPNFHS